jgi:hypothetical protein
MYRKDGQVYRVQVAVHGSGKPYAKALVETGQFHENGKPVFEWDYRGRGPLHNLRASDMMTLAEAKEFGALFGVCCVCGALLTDEKSIEAGIGPVCAQGGSGKSAFAWKQEIYQTDEERDAAILREREQDAIAAAQPEAKPAATRTITMGSNKYGPTFQIRWDYSDPDFGVIKDEVKSWDWESTKRRWNPEAKCWEADAKSDASAAIISEFATRRGFTLSPEAKSNTESVDPAPSTPDIDKQAEAIQSALPVTFNDLLKAV